MVLIVYTASGGIYRGVKSVELVVDGTPVDCAVSDYHTVMNAGEA